MFVVSSRIVCICLFLQLVTGRSLDFNYNYQEIEDPFAETKKEVKNLEFQQLSDDVIAQICKNFEVTIHIKEPESFINCQEPIFDRSRSVILVKRDADELEGSGDVGRYRLVGNQMNRVFQSRDGGCKDSQDAPGAVCNYTAVFHLTDTDAPVTATTSEQNSDKPTDTLQNKDVTTSKPEVVQPEHDVVPPEPNLGVSPKEWKPVEETFLSSEIPEIPTGSPGTFQGGFDNILRNIPREQNNSFKDIDSDVVLKASATNSQINVKPDATPDGEEAKTGESQEQPTAASPNNMLLIVIAALGVIGALAFVYNFVKSRKESKEIDEVVRLETEGKELKEMKPLMRSPLAQNGAKSMEYIDADPQIQVPTETRVEVNREHNSE